MLLNDVTAAISPDPEHHIIDHIFLIALKLFIDVLLFSLHIKILITNTYCGYLNQARLLVDIMERSVFNGENNERRTTRRMRTAGRPKFDISRDQLVYLIIDGVQDLVK